MKSLKISFVALFALFMLAGCDEDPWEDRGTADVQSIEFEFDPSDASLDQSGTVASAQFEVPAITESVVIDGAVLMFYRDQGTWTAMPYTYGVESEDLPAVDYTMTIGFGFERRFIEVFLESSTAEVDPRDEPSRMMKAVIINEFPLGKASEVNLKDYESVKKYFGLKD